MESTHPFSVSFAPCFQAVLCRSRLFFRMFLDKLFQICADRFIVKQKRRCFSPFLLSPSSRRAWIEIFYLACPDAVCLVALLAEGVDRNVLGEVTVSETNPSPSSRRAWIEILRLCDALAAPAVALLAEGVDRNLCIGFRLFLFLVALLAEGVDRNMMPAILEESPFSRPPRGGRG